ncbi:MAG: hypothetical protein WAT19_17200 [Ferruginibacter sp.]
MKAGRIILIVVLAFLSMARWAWRCSKAEERNLHNSFNEKCTAVEEKKQLVLGYIQFGADSAEKTRVLTRSMDSTLSAAIDHYRLNYKDDEKRYQLYLEVLFVYKKMVYAFQKWYKDQNPANSERKSKAQTAGINDLSTELNPLYLDLQHKKMAVFFNK